MEVSIAAISEQEIRNALETGWRDFEDALQYSDALLIEMEGLAGGIMHISYGRPCGSAISINCNKDIIDEIRKSTTVILGVSAGSCNMANPALDIWESHIPYNGLG